MTGALSEFFYPDTVEEWLVTNLEEKLEKLSEITSLVDVQLRVGARVKDSDAMDVNGI